MTISRAAMLSLMATGAAALASCSSPTYGTGVRSDVQLMEDVTNAIALAPPQKEKIVYNPRPELVKPADKGALPPPQTDVVAGNAAWPESPEQLRARIRAEATENRDNPNFVPQVAPPTKGVLVKNTAATNTPIRGNPLKIFAGKEAKRQEINARIAQQPDPTGRRYLSDPPEQYKQVVETAPVNDIGEDETVKEKRRKKLLKANDKKGWLDWLGL